MNPLSLIYSELITRPIVNILVLFLALTSGNLGLSIILLTLVVRAILYSTTASTNMMSKTMTDISPKMQELQEKHKDDPDKLAKETMNLLKTQGAGPLKWCLWLLLQIPVFISLLNVIQRLADNKIFTEHSDYVYSFFAKRWVNALDVSQVNHMFLGMNLLDKGNIILAVICGALLFVQTTTMTWVQPKSAPQKMPNGQEMPDMSKMMPMMNIFMVFMMGSFVYSVQSGVWLYMITSTGFGLLQFFWQYRQIIPIKIKALLHRK